MTLHGCDSFREHVIFIYVGPAQLPDQYDFVLDVHHVPLRKDLGRVLHVSDASDRVGFLFYSPERRKLLHASLGEFLSATGSSRWSCGREEGTGSGVCGTTCLCDPDKHVICSVGTELVVDRVSVSGGVVGLCVVNELATPFLYDDSGRGASPCHPVSL